jgi:hypothetical protein
MKLKYADACEWCRQRPHTTKMADGLNVCSDCSVKVQEYYHCCICGDALNIDTASWARRSFERKACGRDQCKKKLEVKQGQICCEKAEYTQCVCARSYICPDHYPDGIHIGTHD